MNWNLILAVWAIVFIVIQVAVRLALRKEPTAHGQSVGRFFGFWLGLFWPLTLTYLAIVGVFLAAAWLWQQLRRLS